MPHAEPTISTNATMSSKPTINGDLPHSQTLSHIVAYRLVSDLINHFESNPLGAKSIEIVNSLYAAFGRPLVPYFRTPYSIVAPYLSKADSIGNSGLDQVDNHFPAVKDTGLESIKSHAFQAAHYPFKVAGESRDYVFKTYNDEYKKTGGQGVVTSVQALVSTELRIVSDSIHGVADFIGPRAQSLDKQAKDTLNNITSIVSEKTKIAQKQASDAGNDVKKTADGVKKTANEKAEEAKKTANDKADEAKKELNKATK